MTVRRPETARTGYSAASRYWSGERVCLARPDQLSFGGCPRVAHSLNPQPRRAHIASLASGGRTVPTPPTRRRQRRDDPLEKPHPDAADGLTAFSPRHHPTESGSCSTMFSQKPKHDFVRLASPHDPSPLPVFRLGINLRRCAAILFFHNAI